MDDADWGPWIQHDGAEPIIPECPRGATVVLEVTQLESGIPVQRVGNQFAPNWYWRWQKVRVGWFGSRRKRVCDDPAYAPIIRYRVKRPRALADLRALIADLPVPTERVLA